MKNCAYREFLRPIRSIWLLLLLSICSHQLQAQDLQLINCSVQADNIPIKSIFESVEKQTGYTFLCMDNTGILNRRVSLHLSNSNLQAVLDQLHKQAHLNFILKAKQFLVKDQPEQVRQQTPARSITGAVTDKEGTPLYPVSIRVKGTSAVITTDNTGHYQLSASQGDVLEFFYGGFEKQEKKVGDERQIYVALDENHKLLDEVVVIGYGTQKKADLTGSIATVEGNVIAERHVTQVAQALQGTMPGVTVTRTNTEPGTGATIKVRGITTIGNSDPLVIVDGVPFSSINNVNPNDIKDISVLKDAASASIYGARAASGVILITTKRAQAGQLDFEYKANFGFETPTAFPEVVGVKRYLEMINEFTWNDAGNRPGGDYALYSKDDVDNWLTYNKTNPNKYPVTDWTHLLINRNAPKQTHSFSFTGGGEKIKTQASVNYEHVDALYDYKSFERVMTRVNNTIDINKYLTANVDLAYNYTATKAPVASPIWDAQRFAPIYAATWADGRIAQGQNGSNAYAELKDGGFNDSWNSQFTGRVSLQFKPTKDLSFTAVLSPYLYNTKGKNFNKQIPYYAADDPSQQLGYIAGHTTTSLYEDRNDGKTLTKQFLANYSKELKNHHLNLLAGYEDFYSFDETLGAQALNYELSSFPYLDLGPLDFMKNTGSATETAYHSYFGRMLYNYQSKYYLQANIRYDGSSRFHPDHRWGSFPSISAGWVITEEKFMKEVPFLSFLKLRASWGQLGNERIGNYPYQSSIGYSNALFYEGGKVVSAITAAQVAYAIQNITWETTETKDIGLDAYFLKNRLLLTADYYHKQTKNMLLELEIPRFMGYENPEQNTGTMYTKGWDVQLSWNDRIGQLHYSVSANFSDYKSIMGNLGGIVLDGPQIKQQGSEFNAWYGYRSAGLFQTQEEVDKSPKLYATVKPGDVKYQDISGPDGMPDGKITPDYDRVPLGGSLPRYTYGGRIAMDFKGIDFSMDFQGVGEQTSRLVEQMVKPFTSAWMNAPKIIDGNYWSQYNTAAQNLHAKYPRLSYTAGENNNYVMSDYWLINGAYFRLKNIMIGYNLPERWISRAKLKGLRVYASANDLFSFNHFPKGWDPEVAYNTYISKTYNLGLSIKF